MNRPETNSYLRTKVMSASPAELRLLLIDGAIRFAEQARDGLAAKDFEEAYNGTTQCQAILMELIAALRPEVDRELCERLQALYLFLYRRLIAASSERDPAIVEEVLRLLRYDRETWRLLMEQLAEPQAAAAPAGPPSGDGPGIDLRG